MRQRARLALGLLLGGISIAGVLAVPSADAITIQANIPAASSGTAVLSVAAGERHTCAVLRGGRVKCWGANSSGQLGTGENSDRGRAASQMGDFLPSVDLGSGRTARSVAVGLSHTCAILNNGGVKCWGGNSSGQLGQGDVSPRGDDTNTIGSALLPVRLGSGRTARAVVGGGDHTCALLDNGSVKCWGANESGQLGLGDNTGTKSRIGDSTGEMGDSLRAVSLGTGRRARAITAGYAHTCALLDNGTVKCWGLNGSGQLGYGDMNNRGDNESVATLPAVSLGAGRRARAIAAGYAHTCALLDNGSVKCWGYNFYGQLGYGDIANRGDNESIATLPAVNLGTGRRAKSISAGSDHVCAILDNSTIKCWGYNSSGQAGIGTNVGGRSSIGDQPGEMGDALAAVALAGRLPRAVAAGNHTCALLDNATIKCWGYNANGQLGYGDTLARGDNESVDVLAAVNLGVRVRSISAASDGACALLEDRTVQCWGDNTLGRGGIGSIAGNSVKIGDQAGEMGNALAAVPLGTGRTVRSLATGPQSNHQCAILDNGTVKCWGWNFYGQLGIGSNAGSKANIGDQAGEMGDALPTVFLGGGRTARSLAIGSGYTCALLDNYTVKCWGSNVDGQLGNGNNAGSLTNIGDEPGEMEALQPVNLGTGRTARALTAGDGHACALLDNGSVKCWGYNGNGQLGVGSYDDRGDGPNEMGNSLPAVRLGTGRRARAVSAGGEHTCALLDNYTVKCWGYGPRLGYENGINRGGPGDAMGNDLDTVSLGSGRRVRAISVGGEHTCALLDNYTVKCWGNGSFAALGIGSLEEVGSASDTMGDYLPIVALGGSRRAIAVSAGKNFTCALLDDYTLRCWGNGFYGQLGRGNALTVGDGAGEMGPDLKPTAMTG